MPSAAQHQPSIPDPRRSRRSGGVRHAHLLTLDPDLGRLLSAERRAAAAGGLVAAVVELSEGPLDLPGLRGASPHHIGLLLIAGVVGRDVVLGDTVSTELLGPGDLIRPWTVGPSDDLLETTVEWSVLAGAVIALLDRRLAAELCRFPELYAALLDRQSERARRLATTQAISQMTRVDRRLLALFWHLAERWGRVVPGGVHLPLRLTHRILGQLVGARRPTVSAALTELVSEGEVARRADGTWQLTGRAPSSPRMGGARRGEPRLELVPGL